MSERFRKWFRSGEALNANMKRALRDPVLGEMTYDFEESCWHAQVEAAGRARVISVRGDAAPDPTLLQHARTIGRDFQTFETRVADFLHRESDERHWASLGYREEIIGLTIDRVDFPWADQPESGTVFFEGGFHNRLWRCHFDGTSMRSLVFDS